MESASFVHIYRKKLAGLKSPNPAALNISQQTRSNIISGELKAGKPPLLLIGIALVNSLMKMAGETSVSVLLSPSWSSFPTLRVLWILWAQNKM